VQLHSQITVEIPEGIDPLDIDSEVMALLSELNLSGAFVVR
jgi:glycine cleavage system transcriptional repressor